jgi:hypothetical protein
MNAFCPVVLPSAISTKVSSDRMTITSGFKPSDFASPFFTVPVFFRSMVHDAFSPAAFLTWNSKMPLFCGNPVQESRERVAEREASDERRERKDKK